MSSVQRNHPYRDHVVSIAALLVIMVTGTLLRVWPIQDSLWVDELHTAWTVTGSFADVAPRAMLGNNGPLYFTLVRFITQLLGASEASLRSLSILSGVCLMLATYGVSRAWNCSRPASLIATTLVGIDTNNLFFASEARPYALVQLVALGHLFFFVRMLRESRHRWIACWVFTAILMFHLHCTTALLLLAEVCAFVCCRLTHRSGISLKPTAFAFAMVLVGIGCLPAVDLLLTVAERRENWEQFVSQQPLIATLTIYPVHVYLVVPAIAGLACVTVGKRPFRDLIDNKGVSLIVCIYWLCVPILAAWLLTETDLARLFFRRYVIGSSVSLALLTAHLLSGRSPNRWLAISGWCAVLAAGCWGISPLRHVGTGIEVLSHGGEGWRDAIEAIPAGESPVLLRSGLIEADAWHDAADPAKREYCQLPVRGIYKLPHPEPVVISLPTRNRVTLSRDQRAILTNHGRAWLLARGKQEDVDRCRQELLASMEGDPYIASERNFGRVRLIELCRP